MTDRAPSVFVHEPLPYVVRARIVHGDDVAPQVQEFRVIAYSVIEAVTQVCLEAGGTGFDNTKVKVEDVRPDLAGYTAMYGGRMHALLEALKK